MNKALVINSATAARDWFFGDSKSRNTIRWTFYVMGKVIFSLALGCLIVDGLFYAIPAVEGWDSLYPPTGPDIKPQEFVQGMAFILHAKLIAAMSVAVFVTFAGGWNGPRR